MLKKKLSKFKLVNKLLNNIEINSKELSIINDYSELKEALKIFHNKKISSLKFLYSNLTNIKKILYESDKIVKINKNDITNNYIQCYFYLYYIILDDNEILNFSYDLDLVKELYNRMIEEKQTIRKFILYILAYQIVNNIKESDKSNSSDELQKISEAIKKFINNQNPIVEKYKLEVNLNDDIKIDDIYFKFIHYIITNEKLKNFNEAKDIMEQLGLENIELTHNIYINLKKEFDDNSNEKYIDQYKIVNNGNIKDIINEDLINFYYILLKYVFKNEIYIYYIDFFLQGRKSLLKMFKNNYEKLFFDIDNIKNVECKEKINYVLIRFLDSYNYIDKVNKTKFYKKKILREIYIYYKNYRYESKKTDIRKIENFLNNNKELKEINEYIQDFDLARKMNIIFPFVKDLFYCDEINENNEAILNSNIKDFDEIVKYLTEKFELDDNIIIKLFNFFDIEKQDISNKDDVFNAFNEKIMDYIKTYGESEIRKTMDKWNIIETYFKNKNFLNKGKEDIVKFVNEKIESFFKDELIKNILKVKKKLIFYSISFIRKNDDESDEEFATYIEHHKNGIKITALSDTQVSFTDSRIEYFENRSNKIRKNKEREKYLIFHFLIDIRKELKNNYNKKDELIIKIFELEFDGKNNECEYQIFKINDEHEPFFKGTINMTSEGAKIIIDKINGL